MPFNRSIDRDVHIYNAKDPNTILGGLRLTRGVTNANFHAMIEIFCIFELFYNLQNEDEMVIQRDDHPLRPGKYFIVTEGSVAVSNEPWLVRTISVATGSRLDTFRDSVRERDGRCVITGIDDYIRSGDWTSYKAAHIFPLAYQSHWSKHNFSRWITIAPQSGSAINSIQNGILLRSHIHALFDNYHLSINPDNNYKILCFTSNRDGIAGNHLDQQFINDPRRPVDQLLRWHFRQAVFANMRGAGEPIFEGDFPPGSDMMGEITSGPYAAELMEFQLFSRLAQEG